MKFGKSWQSKGELKIDCLNFTNCSVEKLQLCNYFENFLKRTEFLKDIVAADREGDWKAPLLIVQNILPMFSKFDNINYLQYGSLCLENMHCQVSSSFNAVAGDMNPELTIQRSQKGIGCITSLVIRALVVFPLVDTLDGQNMSPKGRLSITK